LVRSSSIKFAPAIPSSSSLLVIRRRFIWAAVTHSHHVISLAYSAELCCFTGAVPFEFSADSSTSPRFKRV
jgi:hypothetical protein